MMIVLPLFERYIQILEMSDTSGRSRFQIMADELKLAHKDEAEKFWVTFRPGFCHTAMPLTRGKKIKTLPTVRLAAEFSSHPEFLTTPTGQELVRLAPWKFIDYVMNLYRNDPNLLILDPDAPLNGDTSI